MNCCVKNVLSIQAFARHLTAACRRRQHVFPKGQDAVTHSHGFISQTNGILGSTVAKTQNSHVQTATRNVSERKKYCGFVCENVPTPTSTSPRLKNKRGSEFRTKNSHICYLMRFIYQNFAQKIHPFATQLWGLSTKILHKNPSICYTIMRFIYQNFAQKIHPFATQLWGLSTKILHKQFTHLLLNYEVNLPKYQKHGNIKPIHTFSSTPFPIQTHFLHRIQRFRLLQVVFKFVYSRHHTKLSVNTTNRLNKARWISVHRLTNE